MSLFWLGLILLLGAQGCGGRSGAAIKALPQTIAFATAPALALPGSAVVAATASSGLAVNYGSTTLSICTVDSASGIVTSVAAGTCIVTADQAGDTDYAPAVQASLSISVAPNPVQSISFATAPVLSIYGSARVTATASSGLAVSYSSATPSRCSVSSSGVVSVSAAGVCTIAADQSGDAHYSAAPQATLSITVPAWSGAITPPDAPAEVAATLGDAATVAVSFIPPASSGGSPITSYSVSSIPAGISASGAASPVSVACAAPCRGYAFAVTANNAVGAGAASASVDVLTRYAVKTTFFEPDTQPNDTIFSGTFTLNATTGVVSDLQGKLTESMTGPPMTEVTLAQQLSAVPVGSDGLLVTSFALKSTDVFAEGGFASGSEGLYFGFPSAKNPMAGGEGNSFVTIYINLNSPIASLTPAQLSQLAYGDCVPGGMMGDTCMTGHAGIGTMGGYPVSQVITKR